VLYVPGLADVESIAQVVKAVAPKPVNVVMGSRPFTFEQLASAGARRVSFGGSLYRCSMGARVDTARALRADDFAAAARGIPSR
jgi:2-methylisocitrate lyase-like PEP mutase family enzyme